MKNINENRYELLKLTNDYVFKRIFGHKGNESITSSFIKAATGIEYKNINLEDSPILDRDLIQDKLGILDVKVIGDENNNIDLEMQVASNDYIADRILWYWANMYVHSIQKGNTYDMTRKTICILIADFDVKNLENISKYRTDFKLRESENKDVILTEKIEIVIIELRKLENIENLNELEKELLNWCKFIKNPDKVEESIMTENENIRKAKEELDKISQDKRERRLAELREKAIMDNLAIKKSGYNAGKEEGKKEGRLEWKIEGKQEQKIEIARKMLEDKIDVNIISKYTGLNQKEIENL